MLLLQKLHLVKYETLLFKSSLCDKYVQMAYMDLKNKKLS